MLFCIDSDVLWFGVIEKLCLFVVYLCGNFGVCVVIDGYIDLCGIDVYN